MMQVAFTFDDGLVDHIKYAAPVLEKYGYRGVFCIVPDYIGRVGYMTWAEVRDLASRGHEIAAHTLSHMNLQDLFLRGEFAEIEHQIVGSRIKIKQELGFDPVYMAFPHNAHNGQLYKMVRLAGMEPLTPHRLNLGGAPADDVEELGKLLCEFARRRERHVVLMFHGLVRGSAYASYQDDTSDSFERRVCDVKKYDGINYAVRRYGEVVWPLPDIHSVAYRIRHKIKIIFQELLYSRPLISGLK